MKLLYIPPQAQKPETDDLYKAFQKRCEVHFYTDMASAIGFRPDVVYIQSGAQPIEIVQRLKHNIKALWTQWTGDYRPERLEPVLRYKDICDITFLADRAGLYPELNCKYLPHGVADWQFREINPDAKGIIFIGNHYDHLPGGKERYELCRRLSHRNDFTWIGTGGNIPFVPFEEIPDYYNRHKFAIAANIYNDAPGWIGNRALMAMAAGCCTLIRRFPGVDDIFNDTCQIYDSNDDLIWMLAGYAMTSPSINPSERIEKLLICKAKEAQQLIRENFTYGKIVESYLSQL